MLTLGLGLLLLGSEERARAQVRIETDTTWQAQDSPITVDGSVVVVQGVTLTVEPGVTVELTTDSSLIIEGELVARGTEASPILFTGRPTAEEPERWGSVVLTGWSTDADYVDVDDYVAGSIVEHCRLEYATQALVLQGASPLIARSTFQNNLYEAGERGGGAAIHVMPGSAPRISECTFTDNVAVTPARGGAILVEDASPIIQDNTFTRNVSAYGGAVAIYNSLSPVVGNVFEDNVADWEGGGIALQSASPALLNNRLTGNHAMLDGGGVHVCVDCYPHATPFLVDNTITDNANEILGAAGVGAAYLRMVSRNNIHGNLKDGEPADFGWFHQLTEGYPGWMQQADLTNNWWGTTDIVAIAATIEDGEDEAAYGTALFAPPLDGPVTEPQTRVIITSLKIGYEHPDEPMPVVLTLYNPGPAREVRLLLLIQYEGLAPLPWRGPLDLPEAQPEDDGFRLTLPENAVSYTSLLQPAYAEMAETAGGTWHAVLVDSESGDLIGEPCSTRFAFGLGGHP